MLNANDGLLASDSGTLHPQAGKMVYACLCHHLKSRSKLAVAQKELYCKASGVCARPIDVTGGVVSVSDSIHTSSWSIPCPAPSATGSTNITGQKNPHGTCVFKHDTVQLCCKKGCREHLGTGSRRYRGYTRYPTIGTRFRVERPKGRRLR